MKIDKNITKSLINNLDAIDIQIDKRFKLFKESMGSGYEKTSGGVLKERHYAYRKLRNALLLNNSDSDVAKSYYVAYNTLINERLQSGFVNMAENKKYAEKTIMKMIEKMNPLDISNQSKGRLISKRREFLNFLSPENEKHALKLEKEFQNKEWTLLTCS